MSQQNLLIFLKLSQFYVGFLKLKFTGVKIGLASACLIFGCQKNLLIVRALALESKHGTKRCLGMLLYENFIGFVRCMNAEMIIFCLILSRYFVYFSF